MEQTCCVSRDTDEWAESILEFIEGIIQDNMQYSSLDSTFCYHRNNTDSEASSIISFLRDRGPYHGWEYDEYFGEHYDPTQPERQQAVAILPLAHSGSDNSLSHCDGPLSRTSRADSWSQGQDPLLHSPQSPYWNSRSLDSNGSLRIAVNRDRFSFYGDVPLTPESHRIPTPLRWAWYRPHSDDDDTDEDTQMSQRSLENIFGSIHGEDAFLPISPGREKGGTDAMQGGGKEEFQPTKTDVNKLAQKLKCIQHGYQRKQMRMVLASDSKFMRKIERTTDAKQLQDCARVAAQRMGLVLPVPTQHDGKGQAQQQSSKNPSSSNANQHNLPAESPHPPAGQGK